MLIKTSQSRKDKMPLSQQFSQYTQLNPVKETTPENKNERTS